MLGEKAFTFNVEKFKGLLKQNLLSSIDDAVHDKRVDLTLRAGLVSFRPFIVKGLNSITNEQAHAFYKVLCEFMTDVTDATSDL